MKTALRAAGRFCALGLALAVTLAVSPAVDGAAMPDEQHPTLEAKSKPQIRKPHGAGYDICTDHEKRALFHVEDEFAIEPRSRDDAGFPERVAPVEEPRTWTFLFYNDADFYNAYDPFVHFARDARPSDNVNVIILRDRNDGLAMVWRVDESHRSHFLVNWGEMSMARPATLQKFIEYGKEHFPADRYMLAMYDHGGGWRGACADVTDGGSLTMREIAQGIGDAGGVDILAFTAPCMMGAIESVYEVRECVDVYIGSEDLSGYVYWHGIMGNICDVLDDSESLSNEDIGRRIIELVKNNPRWLSSSHPKTATMSAMSTSRMTPAVEQLAVVSEYLAVHAALYLPEVKASWGATWRLGQGTGYDTKTVDIIDFSLRLSERVSDPFLLEGLEDLRALLDEAILAECHRAPPAECRPRGLSIHFPRSMSGYAPVYGRVLDMTADTSWDEFIFKHLQYRWKPEGNLAGSVLADCPAPGSPLEGVTVTACQTSTGDLLGAAASEPDGSYEITGLIAENYTIEAFPPLGYAMADGGINIQLNGGIISGLDVALLCTGESNNPRGTAYWKRAVGEAMGGGGQALLDASEICACLDAIDAHFTSSGIDVYSSGAASTCETKLSAAADLLHPLPPVKTDGVARCHLMALLLNVAAGNMRTDDVVSKDGATVSQAITHCYDLLSTRPVDALVIANLVNNGCKVPPGRIPLSTPQILFSPPTQPEVSQPPAISLSVSVSPNPFNPTTTISFSVSQTSQVTVTVYDITGRRVTTLVDRAMSAGLQQVVWNGRDATGGPVGSGMYFYRVTAGGETAVGKLLLLK
jgi:hypothetical protein